MSLACFKTMFSLHLSNKVQTSQYKIWGSSKFAPDLALWPRFPFSPSHPWLSAISPTCLRISLLHLHTFFHCGLSPGMPLLFLPAIIWILEGPTQMSPLWSFHRPALSNFIMYQNHLDGLLKYRLPPPPHPWSSFGWSLRICMSNIFPVVPMLLVGGPEFKKHCLIIWFHLYVQSKNQTKNRNRLISTENGPGLGEWGDEDG